MIGTGAANRRRVFRLHPVAGTTTAAPVASDRAVCGHCLSGACCSSEGPIAVSAFDLFRLAAHLDLSPSRTLHLFTQDRFSATPFDSRQAIDDPASSVVTYLRRRGPEAQSPCIFLRYESLAGRPVRRVCSVHPARPLACREYYFDTCKTRWTGELAIAIAEGFEALADGRVTAADARRALAGAPPGGRRRGDLTARWTRAIWAELARAADPVRANREGSVYAGLAAMQDPMADKLARAAGKVHLRFEEKYGYVARDEQIATEPLVTATPAERARLLRVASTRAPRRLFSGQDYPLLAGTRYLGPVFADRPGPTLNQPAPPTAMARGIAWLGAVAWQIAHRGPSPDRAADVRARAHAWLCLAHVRRTLPPIARRDDAFDDAWRRLSRLLPRALRPQLTAMATARGRQRPRLGATGAQHLRQGRDGAWGADAVLRQQPAIWQADYLQLVMALTAEEIARRYAAQHPARRS